MRPLSILAAGLALAPGVLSVSIQKSILVTYKKEAPRVENLVDEGKRVVLDMGGSITHTFEFIRGFAAKVPADVVDVLRDRAQEWIVIEEDSKVQVS